MELPNHRMLRRVETRWIQLLPVVVRLLEQLPALRNYFLQKLPLEKKVDMTNPRVARIRSALQDPLLEIELNFLKAVLAITDKFEKYFQKSTSEIDKLVNKARSYLFKWVYLSLDFMCQCVPCIRKFCPFL